MITSGYYSRESYVGFLLCGGQDVKLETVLDVNSFQGRMVSVGLPQVLETDPGYSQLVCNFFILLFLISTFTEIKGSHIKVSEIKCFFL